MADMLPYVFVATRFSSYCRRVSARGVCIRVEARALAFACSVAAGPALAIDPFFPDLGNDGIDVAHYTLDLKINPLTDELDAWASLDVMAERPLVEFTLDLRGLDATRVTVNGYRAAFSQDGDKLTIAPRRPIPAKASFRVYVAYGGVPESVRNPTAPDDPTLALGWVNYRDATYVAGEPVGASSFFPVERPAGRQGDLHDRVDRSRALCRGRQRRAHLLA